MPTPRKLRLPQQNFAEAVHYIRSRRLRRFRWLLARYPELLRMNCDSTLLMYAGWWQRYDFVEQLLERGADPDFSGDANTTLLMHAAAENDVRLATQLLNHGAAMERHNERFETPLGYACSYDAVDAARLLCERGADVNGTEGWGRSYLHSVQCASAANPLQAQIEQILLAHGARSFEKEPKLIKSNE